LFFIFSKDLIEIYPKKWEKEREICHQMMTATLQRWWRHRFNSTNQMERIGARPSPSITSL